MGVTLTTDASHNNTGSDDARRLAGTTTAIADRSTTKKLMHDEFVYFLENTNEPKSMNISRPMW